MARTAARKASIARRIYDLAVDEYGIDRAPAVRCPDPAVAPAPTTSAGTR